MTVRYKVLGVILACCAAVLPAVAADAAGPNYLPPAQQQWKYVVQAGDVLAVAVVGEASYTGSFEVSVAGLLLFPDQMVKEVPVAGLTTEQAQAELTRRLSQYYREPQVRVELKSFRVVVSGSVVNPGQYLVDRGASVLQAIEKAGGASERQMLGMVFVHHGNGAVAQYRMLDFMERGVASENPLIEPGDAIGVGQAPGGTAVKVEDYEVHGAVKKPGRFPLAGGQSTRIWDAYRAAMEGDEDADLANVTVRHKDGTTTKVDISRLAGDAADPANIALAGGDVMFVPRLTMHVTVMGSVARPGAVPITAGTTLLEALGKAGGIVGVAVLKDCAVVRQKPQFARIPVNLEKVLKQGLAADNVVLQDGDMLWVPPAVPAGARPSTWDRVNETLRTFWFIGLL